MLNSNFTIFLNSFFSINNIEIFSNIITIIGFFSFLYFLIDKKVSAKRKTTTTIFDAFIKSTNGFLPFADFKCLYISPKYFEVNMTSYIKEFKKPAQLYRTQKENSKIDEELLQLAPEQFERLKEELAAENEKEPLYQENMQAVEKEMNEEEKEAKKRYEGYEKLSDKEKGEYLEYKAWEVIGLLAPKSGKSSDIDKYVNFKEYIENVYKELTKSGYDYNYFYDQALSKLNDVYNQITNQINLLNKLHDETVILIKEEMEESYELHDVVYWKIGKDETLDKYFESSLKSLDELSKFIKDYAKKAEKLSKMKTSLFGRS